MEKAAPYLSPRYIILESSWILPFCQAPLSKPGINFFVSEQLQLSTFPLSRPLLTFSSKHLTSWLLQHIFSSLDKSHPPLNVLNVFKTLPQRKKFLAYCCAKHSYCFSSWIPCSSPHQTVCLHFMKYLCPVYYVLYAIQ